MCRSRFDSRSYRTKDIDGTGRDVNGTKAIANLQRGKEELDITNPDTRIRNIHICKIPTYHCGRKECHPMHPVVCYPFNLSSSNAEYQWPSDYNCLGPHDLTSEPWSPFQPEDAARCCDGVWCLQCTQCGTYEEADEFGGGEVDTINECWSVRACLVELNRFNVMLPVVWVVRLIAAPCVLVPNHPKEIGSAGLGLLSSMPLSSLDRDRLRLFVVPTIVNAAMMIFVAATAECVTLSATFAVAFGAAIVKIVSYCAAVHTMKRGQGTDISLLSAYFCCIDVELKSNCSGYQIIFGKSMLHAHLVTRALSQTPPADFRKNTDVDKQFPCYACFNCCTPSFLYLFYKEQPRPKGLQFSHLMFKGKA